jgi:transcription-repair coupling factor (superfamily II helicase)
MQLTGLVDALRDSPTYRELLNRLNDNSETTLNIIRSARPFVVAALAQDWNAPVVYLTGRIKRAYNVAEQLPVWMRTDARIYRFGEPAARFYERSAWGEPAIRSRIETLAALLSDQQPLVVAAARGLMQRTLPVNHFRQSTQTSIC